MRHRIYLFIITTLLVATVASAAPYRWSVVTFYDWKPMTQDQMTRAKIDKVFVDRAAIGSMEKALNTAAVQGWETVTTTFVPGTPGQDDPRRAADKLVVVMRNPNPPKQ